MHITLSDLAAEFAAFGLELKSMDAGERIVTRIAALEQCQPGDLVFLDKICNLGHVTERKPAALITATKLKDRLGDLPDTAVLFAPNLGLLHALIKQRHGARRFGDSGWDGVHPSAVIHPDARIDPSAVIEPRAVVGRNEVHRPFTGNREPDESAPIVGAHVHHDGGPGGNVDVGTQRGHRVAGESVADLAGLFVPDVDRIDDLVGATRAR